MMSQLVVSLVCVMNQSSHTALMAAAARAAHLIVDGQPRIFPDTLAEALLGDQAEEFLAYHRNHGEHVVLAGARAQVVIRARVTEGHLLDAVASGVDQYVILGAGLDSFAYRSPLAAKVHVFEVDHPATQAVKRERLSAMDVGPAARVSYVPVDFETDSMIKSLLAAGLDPTRPAVVSWLGVSMYLTHDAIANTIAELASLAPGTQLVMDFMLPADLRDEAGQTYVDLVAPNAAERGEPWLSFFSPDELSVLLRSRGFDAVRSVGQREAIPANLWQRTDSLRPASLSMIAHAVLPARPM
jgi:methyltransferase (TIGR00027 family)